MSFRAGPRYTRMDYKLELVLIPVADVDRAKKFYLENMGFVLIVDTPIGEGQRVVQVVPPGSECAIGFGTGITSAAPGSAQGLHLVVSDIIAARADRPGPAPGVRAVGGRTAPGAGELPVVRRHRRSGRQHLAAARGRPKQGLRMDHASFAALTERHRRELHVHCYRMPASFKDPYFPWSSAIAASYRSRACSTGPRGADGSQWTALRNPAVA
jgi:catechol 2,3-dioxygenase-like lactoylglutathione lyase family enzyme